MISLASLMFAAGVAAASSATDESGAAPVCDLTCSVPPRNFLSLQTCLNAAFPPDDAVRLGFHQLPKVTFPGDELYAQATFTSYGPRQPAVVVMAESEVDVVAAVKCAKDAGYNISPRGRNHQYQGLSNMDGYVVVDCSLLCNPDEFVIKREESDWLLPGQKLLGTITSGSGCTNAVMLAATQKNFDPAEGALYAIGTCPSVGITGYTTGGGAGDVTPYVGWGADDFLEVRMVLWDGSIVTANQNQNSDLYWATQGGGSGFGIITSLTTVVPKAPEPPAGESLRKSCHVIVQYSTPDNESRKKFLTALQDYLYEVDPVVSSRFGGGGSLNNGTKSFGGIFLGSAAEFLANFRDNGLLEEDHLDASVPSFFRQNYEDLCDGTAPCNALEDLPSAGVFLFEYDTYGEAMLFKLCRSLAELEGFLSAGGASMTQTSGNWCADLGISSEFCTTRPIFSESECLAIGFPQETCDQFASYQQPDCSKPEVIAAFLEAAYNPLSFLNQAGLPEWMLPLQQVWGKRTNAGGLMIPKVDIDTLMDIDELGLGITHFQHGAPMLKASDSTAWPWRDSAFMTEFSESPDALETRKKILSRLAEFYGGEDKLQGYYNYMGPVGDPNWRYYYFGNNYERLAQIKLKYDPLNIFGNPMQVEPAIPGSEPTQSSGGSEHPAGPKLILWTVVIVTLMFFG